MKIKFFQLLKGKLDKLIGYGVLVVVFLMVASVTRNIGRVMANRRGIEKERQKVAKMQEENKRIAQEIAKTQSPDFIEKQVRDKLGLVREGETEVVLPDKETLKKLAPDLNDNEETLPDPNWRKWLKLFI